jgi:hypothetical protein
MRSVEPEPALLGASPHLLAAARRPRVPVGAAWRGKSGDDKLDGRDGRRPWKARVLR